MDGTLIDTHIMNYKAYKKALNESGFELEYKYYREKCNGKYYKEFLPQVVYGISDMENILDFIHEKKKKYYMEYINDARVNTHLVKIIKCLRNEYKTALVSTASKSNCYELLQYVKIMDLFDLIITREDVLENKPSPEGFIAAMNAFNSTGDETLIFEDSDVGIEAALKVTDNVYATYGYR